MATPKAKVEIVAEDKTQRAFKSVDKSLKKMDTGTQAVNKSMKLMAGVLSVGFLKNQIAASIQFGSAITDTASNLDVGIEALQGLQEASTRAGAGNDILERALRNVKGRVQEASDGNARYTASIERLGLDTEHLISLPLERRLEEFGKAYQNATDKSKAFRDIQNILGERAGPKMIEVLQRLAKDGFDKVLQSAKDSGQVISEDFAKSLDDAADAIEKFNKQKLVFFGGLASRGMNLLRGKELFQDIGTQIRSGFEEGTLINRYSLINPLLGAYLGTMAASPQVQPNVELSESAAGRLGEVGRKRGREKLFDQIDASMRTVSQKLEASKALENFFAFEKGMDTEMAVDSALADFFGFEGDTAAKKAKREKGGIGSVGFANLGKRLQEELAKKAADQRDEQITLLEEISSNTETAGGYT